VSIEDDVREFLVRTLDRNPDDLTSDYPLIENDVLDSMGIFEVVNMLEARYAIEVADDELMPENFDTLSSIARLVESKLPAQ
jgi:acyl carrier protein